MATSIAVSAAPQASSTAVSGSPAVTVAPVVLPPPVVTYTPEKGQAKPLMPRPDGSYELNNARGGTLHISGPENAAVTVNVREPDGLAIKGERANIQLTVNGGKNLGQIETGTGDDTVTVRDSSFRATEGSQIRTQGGRDHVQLYDVNALTKGVPVDFGINTGSESDTVHIDSSRSSMWVSTGSHDDTITADTSQRLMVHPGGGRNTIRTNATETYVFDQALNPGNKIEITNPALANGSLTHMVIDVGGEYFSAPKAERNLTLAKTTAGDRPETAAGPERSTEAAKGGGS